MTTQSKEAIVRALEALESMDDFARMDTGVDPIGPYRVLREFIETRADLQHECDAKDQQISSLEAIIAEQEQEIEKQYITMSNNLIGQRKELDTAYIKIAIKDYEIQRLKEQLTNSQARISFLENLITKYESDD